MRTLSGSSAKDRLSGSTATWRFPAFDQPDLSRVEVLVKAEREYVAADREVDEQPRHPDLTRHLYASLIAYACNLSYAGMADASGISEDALAWTSQWYLRHETLRAANTRLRNTPHLHPLAALWGGGTLSSSDGQRFPKRGRSSNARALSRYFLVEGTTYTHVSNQHSTYGTKVIPTSRREAVIFGNPTDLRLAEHTADTA
jgi:hypothetical protein